MARLFTPWFLFCCRLPEDFDDFNGQLTVAENYLAQHSATLSHREINLLKACGECYLSFYQVRNYLPHQGLLVEDLCLGETVFITEPSAHVSEGDIVFACLLTVNEETVIIGGGPELFPATFEELARTSLDQVVFESEDMIDVQALRSNELRLIGCYLELVQIMREDA